MIIYNLFPLLAGPFTKWGEHFDRAAGMGFDWVFINPIQRLGSSRSLYSIADYFDFNPDLVDRSTAASPEEQARQAITRAHNAGLKVMIDVVINHCAIDSQLTQKHPEWFLREGDGRVANARCTNNGETVVWRDLAQFDHRNTRDQEGLYQYCLRVVEYLIGLGFDGFRCDAAYQVPQHFWSRLIREVKSRHPQAVFVAETLGCNADQTKDTARAGFNLVFNSSKWWNFNDWWLIEQYNLVRDAAGSISFPESHDTPRLAEELGGNINGIKQRYMFSALFSSGVMMPMGFEYGMRKAMHVVNTTPADWQLNGTDLCGWIGKVNEIKKRYPVFHEESPTNILQCHNPNILLMWKASTSTRDEALFLLNKDIWVHQEFYTDNFRHFIQSGSALQDVSPEWPLEYIHEPFHYALRPGQGIILVTQRR